MKDFKKGLGFGMSVVNAGQRAVSEEPELIATSTSGGFRASSSVTRALGVGHGEYIMFIQNVDNLTSMINSNAPEYIAFCQEAGLEPTSAEAAAAFHAEYDVWAIAKGIPLYDKVGNPQTIRERISTVEKKKLVESKYEEMLEAALNSGDEQLIASLSIEGMTDDDKKAVLAGLVQGSEVPKYHGSKCANTSALLGAGTILNFTDSNIWTRLKADLGADAEKWNRKFNVDLEESIPVTVFNGKEEVTVKAYVLGAYTDEKPIVNKKK